MKYFTKELWLAYNDQGPIDSKTAIELGQRNTHEYMAQLILIEFKHFVYKKERCEGSRYQGRI